MKDFPPQKGFDYVFSSDFLMFNLHKSSSRFLSVDIFLVLVEVFVVQEVDITLGTSRK